MPGTLQTQFVGKMKKYKDGVWAKCTERDLNPTSDFLILPPGASNFQQPAVFFLKFSTLLTPHPPKKVSGHYILLVTLTSQIKLLTVVNFTSSNISQIHPWSLPILLLIALVLASKISLRLL